MRKKTRSTSFLIIFSAPSGAGKTSIIQELLRRNPDIKYSISATTRPLRGDEIDGIDYFFLTRDTFEDQKKQDGFAEWAMVHNHYYGTPAHYLKKQMDSGFCVVMDVDVEGARQLWKRYEDIVSIFIVPPSEKVLEERLRGRGTESEEHIRQRLDAARIEMKAVYEYQYVVINYDLEKSARQVEAIIMAEKSRVCRYQFTKSCCV
ncbi:MAG: guanylate kinase [Candidatus Cloacimonetes bacterium 4572_55]|nr:MAG: guanylate kinase [Candidatus Cloacimonetes bacterium 4572_55]